MSNVLKENYKKLVDALAPYFGGASDFDDLTNRPQESDAIDISDLDLPMPAKPTEYPVLFDEAGTEYQVGWYKRASDGKVKPVWRKDATYTISTSSTASYIDMPISLSNFEKGLKAYGRLITGGVSINLPLVSAGSTAGAMGLSNITSSFIRLRICGNQAVSAGEIIEFSVEYIKTTDSWKEV